MERNPQSIPANHARPNSIFDRCTGWIARRPWMALLVILGMSGIAVAGYASPLMLQELFSERAFAESGDADDADAEALPEIPPVNPTRLTSDAILLCESDSFFTPGGARAMRHVVSELEALPYIDNVMWMDRVPVMNIFGLPEPIFPRSEASVSRFLNSFEKAKRHPLVNGQLMSADGRNLLLLIDIDFLFVEDDQQVISGLRIAAEEAAEDFPETEIRFHVSGQVPTFLTMINTHESNQLKYQIIAYSMIGLMSIILFRGVSAVIIVALAPALGVFWTLGIVRFFEFQDNPFNDVVLPVLVSLVGFTDGVHLMVQIRKNRAGGLSPREAASLGIRQVGLACFLTSLTTAIGFGSLSLAHQDVVKEFGQACVIGILVTFVAVITSIPVACSSWLGRSVHVGLDKSLIDKNLGRISGVIDYVLARPRFFANLGIATTLLLFLISLTLRPDETQSKNLPTHSEVAVAARKLDQAMGGLEFSRITVNWDQNVASDSDEVLDVIRDVDQLLAEEELIGHPLSIRNLLDALPGEGTDRDRMSMLDLLPPPLKRAFYTPELRRAQINFRVQDLGIAKYGPVFTRIESGLAGIAQQHPQFQLEMSGSAVWRWRNLYQIVVDLTTSLGTAMIVIFIVLAIVYRSLRIGLISIMPNVFPLAVAGAYLVFARQPLEIVTVCAFTCCLGIAVDDTIHFLTRYREERQLARDERTAIRNAFTGVGTALIMTTIVLVCGFLTVLFSDLYDHRVFATMGAITVAAALFGDLIFLPAVLERYSGGRPKHTLSTDPQCAAAGPPEEVDINLAPAQHD